MGGSHRDLLDRIEMGDRRHTLDRSGLSARGTSHRMIYGIHRHAAHFGTPADPEGSAGLSETLRQLEGGVSVGVRARLYVCGGGGLKLVLECMN